MAIRSRSKARRAAPRRRGAGARPRGSASRDNSLNSLARLTADWYWEQDTRHRVTYMSQTIADRTGAPMKAFVGRTRWEEPALSELKSGRP